MFQSPNKESIWWTFQVSIVGGLSTIALVRSVIDKDQTISKERRVKTWCFTHSLVQWSVIMYIIKLKGCDSGKEQITTSY